MTQRSAGENHKIVTQNLTQQTKNRKPIDQAVKSTNPITMLMKIVNSPKLLLSKKSQPKTVKNGLVGATSSFTTIKKLDQNDSSVQGLSSHRHKDSITLQFEKVGKLNSSRDFRYQNQPEARISNKTSYPAKHQDSASQIQKKYVKLNLHNMTSLESIADIDALTDVKKNYTGQKQPADTNVHSIELMKQRAGSLTRILDNLKSDQRRGSNGMEDIYSSDAIIKIVKSNKKELLNRQQIQEENTINGKQIKLLYTPGYKLTSIETKLKNKDLIALNFAESDPQFSLSDRNRLESIANKLKQVYPNAGSKTKSNLKSNTLVNIPESLLSSKRQTATKKTAK